MALLARRLDGREAARAWTYAAALGGAGVFRVVLDAWFATDYERSMWGGSALVDYFLMNFETACLLVVATGSTLWFAWRREHLERATVVVGSGLIVLTVGTALRNLAGLRALDEQPGALLALLGVVPIAMIALAVRGPLQRETSQADRVMLILLWSAAGALITRYALLESFPLKTGTTTLIVAVLLVGMTHDSLRDRPAATAPRKERFLLHAGMVFAVLALSKAVIWHAATTRLTGELAAHTTTCVEIDDAAMDWVRRSPGAILNNWSLPTLGLVSATARPPVLLLEAGDCDRFMRSGDIVVDPWTVLNARQLPFVFGTEADARDE
jgi:hypothetical protein